jgi:hypothetical protein
MPVMNRIETAAINADLFQMIAGRWAWSRRGP